MSRSKLSTFIHANCLQYEYPVFIFTSQNTVNTGEQSWPLFFSCLLFKSNHLILIKPAQLFISHLTFSKMRLTAQTLQL